MSKNQVPGFILGVMKNLNMVIILYLAGVTTYSLLGYVHENSALEFLMWIRQIPLEPWKIPTLAVGLYLCLLLLLSIRCENYIHFLIKTFLELAVAFFISDTFNFGYTGIILLIIADVMNYYSAMKGKLVLISIICVGYLLLDYDLLSVRYQLVSIESCWQYFNGDMQSVLLGVRNILNSLNMILFIIYMIVIILTQLSEKEQILSLNEKLNDANSELLYANKKLEDYAKEAERAAEAKERNRLAREIHDTLGHSLTGIITGIEACVILMDIAPEATKEQLKAIADVARDGVKDVRRSVEALRPDVLENTDLKSAVIQMIEKVKRSTSVDIEYEGESQLKDFSKDEEDIIYRIVQESITNSIRHGKADRIWVTIEREFNMLKIRIKDNGIGCAKIQKGFGLHHMEERLDMLKGRLEYNGNNGFLVDAFIPIRWGAEEEND